MGTPPLLGEEQSFALLSFVQHGESSISSLLLHLLSTVRFRRDSEEQAEPRAAAPGPVPAAETPGSGFGLRVSAWCPQPLLDEGTGTRQHSPTIAAPSFSWFAQVVQHTQLKEEASLAKLFSIRVQKAYQNNYLRGLKCGFTLVEIFLVAA